MNKYFIDQLVAGNYITGDQHEKIKDWLNKAPFSLHWELRTLLYAGVVLLASGIGILIYDNIDTIGHVTIILIIAALCSYCFYYCFKNKLPFSKLQTKHESPLFDYVLLLGSLLFLTLEGYLQFKYTLFGTHYGLATLIPALVFIFLAYYFDHAGVLSMGITALSAFVGITVSPGMILRNELSEQSLIYTGAALAVFLIGTGYVLKVQDIKRHFTFIYYNFGFHMYFLCMLAGIFTLGLPFIYFALLIVGCALLMRYAIFEKSFYFLLISVIYAYIGITWAIFEMGMGYMLGLYYFVFSCILVIWFFLNYKKLLKLK